MHSQRIVYFVLLLLSATSRQHGNNDRTVPVNNPRQANDVEENPGSTIFDIIDPTTFVSADSSQGNEPIFGVNAGKQCVAMSLTVIIYHQIQDNSTLNNSTLITLI